jgi:type IV pilus biogenesis protein PilP
MIGVIILVLGVVAWQLFGGSGGGSSTPTPTPTPTGKMNASGAGPSMAGGGMGMQTPQAVPPPEMTQPKPAIVPVNTEILKMQQQTQADYLASVSKLQMLKIQKEIDETKTAIANAELSRMTAEKSIADLITSKESSGGSDMGPIGGMPSSPFGSPPPASTTTTTPQANPIVVQAVPQIPMVKYNVLSVAYLGHKWTAVLGLDGKTMTVNVGDTLDDGSMVLSISRNKVLLKRDNKSRALPVAMSNL